ncbi:NAD-dependent protein deacylase [Aminipila luticellarii]|uniref:NAD-dependent protein deacetylase n=1 Tax=Aminipila luticellarii TaxID=2507160 RepID=A0A410PYK5_9FIRM|nr:NAD-dependent protein deacylase [Aminipila luticellarii]QAT43916.1 NAD-dependent protein deacylase [Aminipila luticellarii]
MSKEIEQLSTIIQDSSNIVFFGGAGVSTESNIPDFRSESGLYRAMNKYGKSPETMLSHSFFQNNLETFYDYYKNNLIYKEAKPNKAHLALAKLEAEGKLKAVVTQNIDGLHQLAGSKRVFELHGSVLRNNCMRCGEFYDLDYILKPENCKEKEGLKTLVPTCKKCGGIVKPDVVLYEECLNDEVIQGAVDAISKADTLIVGGTSLVVYPAAGLINYFRGNNLILINKSKTQYDHKANLVIYDAIGKVLGEVCGI